MENYFQYVRTTFNDVKQKTLLSGKKDLSCYKEKINSIIEFKETIINESGEGVYNFITKYLVPGENIRNIMISAEHKAYTEHVDFDNLSSIINLKSINHICHLNEHLKSVNKLLPVNGIYIGRVETYGERKKRFYLSYGRYIGKFLWICDFVVNRIVPKLRPLDKIYKFLTGGYVQTKSQAEILGRLIYCGFEIINFSSIDHLFYFIARKINEPLNDPEPTYHALVRLNRVGKNGKIIRIYKFRTMHPYSEYLQGFVIRQNGYNGAGKPANDFRLATWGRFLRRLWLDELPQIINVLKGEMKLVGIRPLSWTRFNEVPADLQRERIKLKPGCFPPYVALNMPDCMSNLEAERIYINDLKKHPHLTDLIYFIRSIYNILSNRIRSS